MKALLGLKFDVRSFKAKNRVFEFDHQQMNMFEFVRCSKNDVRVGSMFDKMVFDPSLKSIKNQSSMVHIDQFANHSLTFSKAKTMPWIKILDDDYHLISNYPCLTPPFSL